MSLLPASALAAPVARARAMPRQAVADVPAPVVAALAALERHRGAVAFDDVVGVVDFTRHSGRRRFHLVDRAAGTVTSLLVAHGRGSDPEHSGFARLFSNQPGSYASSTGAYVTGAEYVGQHGRSMRLRGLEASNDQAEARAIVIHAAWYVSDDVLRTQGRIGRSEGCFAVRADDLAPVLARLGSGRLLFGFVG